ncbi:MAG TPA: CpsB/CapC family capsule biosynthesis tyrosine phosphatase [Gaiellaceae bacterium]
MIDLHTHVLPGLDDGARTLEDSRGLAEVELAEGVRTLAATPHVRADYPTTVEQMEAGVSRLREDFRIAGIDLEVVAGAEVALERLEDLTREELGRFTLGATGRYLLVEFPYHGWPLALEHQVFELVASGLIPVLAHPERNGDVQDDPKRLSRAVAGGALVQLTAASLDGRLGRAAERTAGRLLELELAHLVASDAHPPSLRLGGLSDACHAVRDDVLANWLVRDVPAAILAGDEPPDRPAGKKRRRFFGL